MEEILKNAAFQQTMAQLAKEQGVPHEKIMREAETYLKELYTVHQPVADMVALQGAQYILSRGYEKTIDVNPAEVKKLAKLMRKYPVAFVMTHKTYIDMFVLAVVLGRHGLPLPYTFAGINMSFLGVGQFGRQVGSIFIRRTFKDNEVYKATLRFFIAYLVEDKSHFMWAIEGTRSRTGKLVWPKLGILKYIAEAAEQTQQEVKYVPVSIVYDLIPDVKQMTAEGRGQDKSPESLSWFLNYIRGMGDSFGRISLRLGDPVEIDEVAAAPDADSFEAFNPQQIELPRFAFELAYRINHITPVTTASLVCATLLSKFSVSKRGLESDIASLMQLIESHKADALVDRGKPIGESVQVALNLLIEANIVQRQGSGLHAKYVIVPSNYLVAVYYANMAVHHLVNRSFIELAIAAVADEKASQRILSFWTEIMALRDLFKFEFFYSRKPVFSDEIEADLRLIDPEWQKRLRGRTAKEMRLLRDQQILVAHAVLYPYIEAYRVVAYALQQWDTVKPFDEKAFLKECIALGEEMHWQGKIQRVEAVSTPFLLNGIRLAQNKALIPSSVDSKKEAINTFLTQLDDIAERLQTLQEITLEKPRIAVPEVPLERDIVPGSKTDSLTREVMEDDSGPHIGAFFDLDRTLIDGFSAKEFFQNRLLSGRMGAREILAQFAGVIVYAMGNGNFAGLAAIGARGVQGTKESIFVEVGEEVYLKHLANAIYPESRALVAAHLAKGHTVAIISAATPYQVDPIARDLAIEHVMCTRMEVVEGKFTGKIIEPACWGDGKAVAARQLAKEHNVDLSKSYFYTDSAEDMPLLEIVGKPRPLNPDTKLSALAYENDWPVYRFTDETRPGVTNLIRTGLLAGSMIPAALAGVATGALNLSWRDGINTMMATIGDLGTRMAGIELAVKGEENLWLERPAVFIFNHQSNADMFIGAKLLRKDARAIAKKELKYTPVGPLFMAAGVIFVDRGNREKAIEALKPAADALQRGISIAIAPEGTRSYDYKLGRFKKGAFHIAMQAGVPIVPMVIKNAHDVLPRGSALIRPTAVEVVVLPPVSTADWTIDNMDERIEEIRALYLAELGQAEDTKYEIEVVEE